MADDGTTRGEADERDDEVEGARLALPSQDDAGTPGVTRRWRTIESDDDDVEGHSQRGRFERPNGA